MANLSVKQGKIDLSAEKGGVLKARILWSFSAAAYFKFLRDLEKKEDALLADRAFDNFMVHFRDLQYQGVY